MSSLALVWWITGDSMEEVHSLNLGNLLVVLCLCSTNLVLVVSVVLQYLQNYNIVQLFNYQRDVRRRQENLPRLDRPFLAGDLIAHYDDLFFQEGRNRGPATFSMGIPTNHAATQHRFEDVFRSILNDLGNEGPRETHSFTIHSTPPDAPENERMPFFRFLRRSASNTNAPQLSDSTELSHSSDSPHILGNSTDSQILTDLSDSSDSDANPFSAIGGNPKDEVPESDASQRGEEANCCVCHDEPRTHMFVPCGHQAVCEDCAKELSRRRLGLCPICRKDIKDCYKIFT